jgi:hypothetical protein
LPKVELGQFLLGAHDAHAASTAARRGLENDRKADQPGPGKRFLLILQHAFGAGQDGDLGFLHRLASFVLLPHEAHGFGSGADELDVRSAANLGEVCILTQKTVSRMNGIDIGDFRGGDHGGHVQITLCRPRRANADGFIGKANVE